MGYILSTLLSYLLLYKYLTIFVVVFTTGIILPLPSNTLLLAAGAFASQGYFSLSFSFAVAIVANVLGDSIGYTLTRKWGYRIVSEKWIKSFRYFVTFEEYVKKHAGLTILFTRFLGTPGVIVNFLSGFAGVSYKRFITFDIIGNALDIGLFLMAGYIVGTFTENFSDIVNLIGWIILIFIFILIITKVLLKKKDPEVV